MAINIKIANTNNTLGDEIIYKRLSDQSPMDFAVTYLEDIESMFDFYSTFNMDNYSDFYNTDNYRISNINNDMRENGYEAATRQDLNYFYTQFDGVNEHIDCGNDNSLNFEKTDSFSFSAWVNFNNSDYQIILGKQTGGNPYNGYTFRKLADNRLAFSLIENSSSSRQIRTTDTVNVSEWIHLTVTYDGVDINGINIYVNGIAQVTTDFIDTLTGSSISVADFTIGGRSDNVISLNGYIDEVSAYNAELNATDILNIYNLGRKNPVLPTTNLVSHWRMDNINPPDEVGVNDGTGVNMDSTNIIKWN